MDESPDGHTYGTVGVVALDRQGNVAAGTSTGGMQGKMPGRVGDSPIIGAGTYAAKKMPTKPGLPRGALAAAALANEATTGTAATTAAASTTTTAAVHPTA